MPSSRDSINGGFFRYPAGEMTVTALHDGILRRPLEGLLRNASVDDSRAALAESGLPTDALTVTFTPILIEHKGILILIDTGHGDLGGETNGFMLENMKAAGHAPDSIDHVIVSHFHPDHINGLRSADGTEIFPSATIHVPRTEWNFWTKEVRDMENQPDAIKATAANVSRVFSPIADKITFFNDGEEILPGITARAAQGHTPGHTAFELSSGNRKLLVMSDICNHPALFVRHPEWSPIFDMLPELALTTRAHFLNLVAEQNMQVSFFHAPFPATGYIEKAQKGFRFIPLATV